MRIATAKSMPVFHHQASPYHQCPHITKAKDIYRLIRSDDIGYLFIYQGSRAIYVGKSQWLA
jgi:hypothetical protein